MNKRERSNYVPQGVRNEVAKRDRGVCQHCKKKAARAALSPRGALQFFDENDQVFHLDHLTPISKGGKHTVDNLVLACVECNQGRRHSLNANDPEIKDILADFA